MEFELLLAYEGPPSSWSGVFDSAGVVVWGLRRGRVEVESATGSFVAEAGEWALHCPARRYQQFSRDAEIVSGQMRLRWPSGANVVSGPTPLILGGEAMKETREAFDFILAFGVDRGGQRELRPDQPTRLADAVRIRELSWRLLRGVLVVGLAAGWRAVGEEAIDPLARCYRC